MEFKENTSVYTVDGKEAGSLHRVVIHPDTKELTHIVIQKGLLFKTDRVIELSRVADATGSRITLNCTFEQIREMVPLEIKQVRPISESAGPGQGDVYINPSLSIQVIEETTRTIPDELVALMEGARVFSLDDRPVGNLERVFTNSETGHVTNFTIVHGLLAKTTKTFPVEWVNSISEDEIHLNVNAEAVTDLPDNQSL